MRKERLHTPALVTELNPDLSHPLDGLTDKQIKKLRRVDLLKILVAQGEEIESLRAQLAYAHDCLADKEITIDESGNLAEAALRLNKIFDVAQATAEQYVQNVAKNAHDAAYAHESEQEPAHAQESKRKPTHARPANYSHAEGDPVYKTAHTYERNNSASTHNPRAAHVPAHARMHTQKAVV
jgi:hypothetical protein